MHCATWAAPKYPWPKESQTPEIMEEFWREDARWKAAYNTCAECGSTKTHVENYDMMWHDGDVVCENGHHVRGWDAG